MSELNANLNQVLHALEQLTPDEIAVIQEHLATRRNNAVLANGASSDIFEISFANYLAMSSEERDAIAYRAYQTLDAWIDAELEKRRAKWILVCGGQVIESSPTLRNYPSSEKLMTLGRERGVVPFVFVKSPLIG